MIWPVILSGGAGTRLWPLSRAETPKQLLAITGPDTLLQDTARRARDPLKFNPCIIVANEAHLGSITAQLDAIDAAPAALILEPAGRNTAPAIGLAAHWVAQQEPRAVMLVMPADHSIADPVAFQAAIDAALPAAIDGWLVTFGITATHAETGYGYIRVGPPVLAGVNRVGKFVEKPDSATAARYVAEGCYVWNSGIFLMRCDRYLSALQTHAPAIAAAVAASMAAVPTGTRTVRPDSGAFFACPADSVDYAVMEHDDRVAVVPVSMRWSDVGSWDALLDIADRDQDGNHLHGDVVAIGTTSSLIRSEGPLVAAIGLTGLTIVATGDSVLVAAAGHSQQVKAAVDQIAAAGRREHLDAVQLIHAWGIERILARSPAAIVLEYEIGVGTSRRAELLLASTDLTVLAGRADILVDGRRETCVAGGQMTVSAGTGCTIRNDGSDPLRIVVVRIVR